MFHVAKINNLSIEQLFFKRMALLLMLWNPKLLRD